MHDDPNKTDEFNIVTSDGRPRSLADTLAAYEKSKRRRRAINAMALMLLGCISCLSACFLAILQLYEDDLETAGMAGYPLAFGVGMIALGVRAFVRRNDSSKPISTLERGFESLDSWFESESESWFSIRRLLRRIRKRK